MALAASAPLAATQAYSAASPLLTIKSEIQTATTQAAIVSPLNPDPTKGLHANYGPTNINWKCNPVRTVSTEPLCKLGDLTAQRTVVLFGDSQANMWAPAFDIWGKTNKWLVIDLHKSSCPPWPDLKSLYFDYTPYPECAKFRTFALNTIRTLKPAVVIPIGLRPLWARGQGVNNGPDQATFTTTIGSLVTLLKPLTSKIVLVPQIPHWSPTSGFPSAPTCAMTQPTNLTACLGQTNSELLEPTVNGAIAASASRSKVPLLATTQLFCTADKCPQVVKSYVIYADPYHMTRAWAQHIAPALTELLRTAGVPK